MGSDDSRRRLNRKATIETLEARQVMSTDPLGGLLAGSLAPLAEDASTLDPSAVPTLELHGTADFQEQAPDFWLDTTYGSFEEQLGEIEQTLASAHEVTGLTQVRQDYGFIGTGQTVAVIDSGIAWDHYALGGGFGANYRVVGGWDFTEENDANPYDDGPSGSHGTHVAGIVGGDAGNGSNDSGVAPGVDLVGLRVFNDQGAGYFSWVENALEWVHQNRDSFDNPITAVNLSLGTNWNADTVPSWAMLEDEFAQLEADGIFISVSAGNSFTSYVTPGLSYPAASSHVVPVMSADDSGGLSYFSQRLDRAIAAPGRYIRSTVPDYAGNHNSVTDDWASFSGTSMAAPYVAGASVLVREAMEFVGYAGITQQTIYDHMMATADQFFDAATETYYSRLNLENAIDALIPDDDFGSSVVDAYNMGSVGGSMEMSGLIGQLDDADYFTFTAGVTGTVSITSATTHGLSAVWDTCNCGSWSMDGDTLTLDVAAGQTYTVGLSSAGGLGYYDLTFDAEKVFTFTDWGTVTQSEVSDQANAGETWYRVEAGQSGYLTVEALFAAAGGDVDLELYDGNLELVASGVSAADSERVDVLANAGDEFYLRVVGTNGDVDFRLTNRVSIDGSAVTVTGTEGDDVFTFAAGTSQHVVSINGVSYQFAAGSVTQINFSGGAGNDQITMTGTDGDETAVLRQAYAELVGSHFTATSASTETNIIYGGGGADTVRYYDTAGDDRFAVKQTYSVMSGDSYSNFAAGFTNVYGYAVNGGNDVSELYDSAGDDHFWGKPTFSLFAGDGFYSYVSGFDHVYAYCFAGGNDLAELYDSTGNDILTSRPELSVLRTTTSVNHAVYFDKVYAYSFLGGTDLAQFYDSAGDDVFYADANYCLFRGGDAVRVAVAFDRVKAFSTAGGYDVAKLHGTAAADVLYVRQDQNWLYGNNFEASSHGFDRVRVYGHGGGDVTLIDDCSAQDYIYGSGNVVHLIRGGRRTSAEDFDLVIARLAHGGGDPQLDLLAIDYVFETDES